MAAGQGKWLQGGDPVTQETSELALGKTLVSPRHLLVSSSEGLQALHSPPLSPGGGGERWRSLHMPLTSASQEGSSHGITWNWSCVGEKQQFSESGMGLGEAAVCWGGFFLSVVLDNVYNLPQSLL